MSYHHSGYGGRGATLHKDREPEFFTGHGGDPSAPPHLSNPYNGYSAYPHDRFPDDRVRGVRERQAFFPPPLAAAPTAFADLRWGGGAPQYTWNEPLCPSNAYLVDEPSYQPNASAYQVSGGAYNASGYGGRNGYDVPQASSFDPPSSSGYIVHPPTEDKLRWETGTTKGTRLNRRLQNGGQVLKSMTDGEDTNRTNDGGDLNFFPLFPTSADEGRATPVFDPSHGPRSSPPSLSPSALLSSSPHPSFSDSPSPPISNTNSNSKSNANSPTSTTASPSPPYSHSPTRGVHSRTKYGSPLPGSFPGTKGTGAGASSTFQVPRSPLKITKVGNRLVSTEAVIHESLLGILIGKQGDRLNRIAKRYQVEVRVLPDETGSRRIRIQADRESRLYDAHEDLQIYYWKIQILPADPTCFPSPWKPTADDQNLGFSAASTPEYPLASQAERKLGLIFEDLLCFHDIHAAWWNAACRCLTVAGSRKQLTLFARALTARLYHESFHFTDTPKARGTGFKATAGVSRGGALQESPRPSSQDSHSPPYFTNPRNGQPGAESDIQNPILSEKRPTPNARSRERSLSHSTSLTTSHSTPLNTSLAATLPDPLSSQDNTTFDNASLSLVNLRSLPEDLEGEIHAEETNMQSSSSPPTCTPLAHATDLERERDIVETLCSAMDTSEE